MGDIKDSIDEVVENADNASSRLNSVIAVLVAVLATVMALFNIKDGNIVQAMAQAVLPEDQHVTLILYPKDFKPQ